MGTGPGEMVLLIAGKQSVLPSSASKLAQEGKITKVSKNTEFKKTFLTIDFPR